MTLPSKYKPEYCQLLIDHMGRGLSFRSFAGTINVGRQTTYDWIQKHPEFKEAKDIGQAKCELFYTRLGLDMTVGELEKCNATTYVWLTKNILKWTDKEQSQSDNQQPINITISKDDSN